MLPHHHVVVVCRRIAGTVRMQRIFARGTRLSLGAGTAILRFIVVVKALLFLQISCEQDSDRLKRVCPRPIPLRGGYLSLSVLFPPHDRTNRCVLRASLMTNTLLSVSKRSF